MARNVPTTIESCLDRAQTYSGNGKTRVFEDWLTILEICLRNLPRHAEAALKTGTVAKDTPEDAAVWKPLAERYRQEGMLAFSQAMGLWLDSSEEDGKRNWQDKLGSLYMTWAYPNQQNAQYFTPWVIAVAMAQMTAGDLEPQLRARLAEEPPQPLTVHEPCIGSGVMLLAFASQCPEWALRFGLVQFSGQDNDRICVQMAKLNFMLYGLGLPFDPDGARAFLKERDRQEAVFATLKQILTEAPMLPTDETDETLPEETRIGLDAFEPMPPQFRNGKVYDRGGQDITHDAVALRTLRRDLVNHGDEYSGFTVANPRHNAVLHQLDEHIATLPTEQPFPKKKEKKLVPAQGELFV